MKRLLLLLSLSLVGCTVGPHYVAPDMEVPCAWSPENAAELSEQSVDNFRWWESFNDPVLNSLIEMAAQQNLGLHLAMTRIMEARRTLKGGKTSAYPHVDGSVAYSYANFNQKTLDRILGIQERRNKGRRHVDIFEAGFDAQWELDLFGMNKHRSAALEAMAEVSEEDFSNAWVTLSAEIARSYIELRGLQLRFEILNNNIESQKETQQLTSSLIAGGFAGSLEQAQVDEELNLLHSEQPQLKSLIEKNIHHLSILLGYLPRELICQLSVRSPLPDLPANRPIGMPAELLLRRPDIRKAERELAAATAEVGVAMAALYPRLSITGFLGDITTACTKGNLVGLGSPQLILPLFNSKLLQDDVCLNKIKVKQALIRYQQTVLEALEETENAITAFHYELEKAQYLEHSKNASQNAHDQISQLYQNGLKSYLEVQTAHRTYLAAEGAFLQGQIDVLLNYISLYKALGGGWDAFPCQ